MSTHSHVSTRLSSTTGHFSLFRVVIEDEDLRGEIRRTGFYKGLISCCTVAVPSNRILRTQKPNFTAGNPMDALFWRPYPDSEEQKTPSVATATEGVSAVLGGSAKCLAPFYSCPCPWVLFCFQLEPPFLFPGCKSRFFQKYLISPSRRRRADSPGFLSRWASIGKVFFFFFFSLFLIDFMPLYPNNSGLKFSFG